MRQIILLILITITLIGCATYNKQRLPQQNELKKNILDLTVDTNKLLQLKKVSHLINLNDGLDIIEVSILAVLNNPYLKVRRLQYKVAEAQVFSAGLLPDPVFNTGIDSVVKNTPILSNGLSIGLDYDFSDLITREFRINNKKKLQNKIKLELLWQEWQVIQQARTLVVRYLLENNKLSLLSEIKILYQQRYQQSKKGMAQGNITLDINGIDLTALVDIFSQISFISQRHNTTRHSLNQLLGLQPSAIINLEKLPERKHITDKQARIQLNKLSDIRPDLLALKAGYQAQEEKVRVAILSQFPSFSIGINRSKDTSGVYTTGFTVGLTLPLFSGNRGVIAIERATRKQLSQEYTQRLLQAQNDVSQLLDLQKIIQKQQDNLQAYLPVLKKLVASARNAYFRGDINALTFLNMESTWINKRLEIISLLQSQWQNHIALQTLLSLPDSSIQLPGTNIN